MKEYRSIVVLTGAGISAESGIQTFRGADGLWEGHRIEDVATPKAFIRDPELVHNFYNQRRRRLLDAEVAPNAAHQAIAELERRVPGVTVITQNIDNLHERAGTRNLIHMHGELLKVRCIRSGVLLPVARDVTAKDRCRCCSPAGPVRPHVVWFGEEPLEMMTIFTALDRCDLFLSIGTSGAVYPAAGFVQRARMMKAHTVELNLEPSETRSQFHEAIHGPAAQVVPEYVRGILR